MKTGIKKTIAFALTLCAVSAGTIAPNAGKFSLSPTPIVAEAAVKSGDFTFTRRSVAAATLTSYVGSATSVTLPTKVTINGTVCTVSGIDSDAFRNTNVKSVTIPEGYTSIGDRVFMNCSSLTNVYLPSTLVAINNRAFEGTSITSITIPSKVKILGTYVFTRCSQLKTANINTTIITELKEGLFSSCSSLTSLKIPSSIKKIGESFAYGCSSLSSITLPSNVTSIGNNAFAECTNLSSVSLPSSVTDFGYSTFRNTKWINNQPRTSGLVIKNGYIIDASKASGTVNIPSTVKKIPAYTFYGSTAITKVVMPTALTLIGQSAFADCTNLTSVNLPTSVNTFGDSVFSGCTSLKSVQLPTYLSVIPKDTFNGCKKLSSIVLPSRIETIKDSAFRNCTALTSITLPEHLGKIEEKAFYNCSSLSNISGVKDNANYDIDALAFEKCMNLKKLNNTTVVSRSGYNVSVYKESFVKKYFSKTDNIGFIKDFVDTKAQAVVDQIKAQHPNYNTLQMTYELEKWMCANGRSPRDLWEEQHGNKNYPSDIDYWKEYHCESSILLNGVAVCEGWAKAYNLLLTKAGITAEIVEAADPVVTIPPKFLHAWNVVKIDGNWFNIDAYWDDGGSKPNDKWFLVSDKEMLRMDTSGSHVKTHIERRSTGYEDEKTVIACNIPMGDVNANGILDTTDVNWLNSYILTGKSPSSSFRSLYADLNYDGKLNSTDLSLLKGKVQNNR